MPWGFIGAGIWISYKLLSVYTAFINASVSANTLAENVPARMEDVSFVIVFNLILEHKENITNCKFVNLYS